MPNNDMNRGFCIKPWTQAMIKSRGEFSLCCHSEEKKVYNIKDISIKEYWANDYLKKIREHMLTNSELPDECRVCKEAEARGETSLRQRSNTHYKIIPQYRDKILTHFGFPKLQPIDIECELTNLCNLRCIMCSGEQSSSLLTENKILKIQDLNQRDFNIAPDTEDKLKEWIKTKPAMFSLRGGEPMMVPAIARIFKYGIEHNLLDDTDVLFITNGTKLTDEWIDILRNLKKLILMVSIDGVGELNNYIRFGSQWDQLESAVKTMQSIPQARVMVSCTLQNINVLGVGDLIEWANANGIFLTFAALDEPKYLGIHNFPRELLELAKRRILQHSTFKNKFSSTEIVISTIDNEMKKPFDQEQWKKFIKMINIRDQHRQNSILSVIPELEPYWHAENQ